MATIRQRPNGGSWEIIIRRKILPKTHCATADTEAEARAYAEAVEKLLDQGIIPLELQDNRQASPSTVDAWIRQYLIKVNISESDRLLLNALLPKSQTWPTAKLNIIWAQDWVSEMKQKDRLSPSSLRHKVGAVARMLDWCLRNEWISVNPLRLLPKRYASYTASDGEKKTDIERDRILQPGEYEKIMWVLNGGFPEGNQRGISMNDRLAWKLLFVLAIETAMRLREMYTLSTGQVDLPKKTIFLDKTKNGDKRQVPLSSVALAALSEWKPSGDLVFPWWDGRQETLRLTTMKLSRKWATIARLAGLDDFHLHDCRHTAIVNFYLKTSLSDLQIMKIAGHKDMRMTARYANLRGSDLAEMLW